MLHHSHVVQLPLFWHFPPRDSNAEPTSNQAPADAGQHASGATCPAEESARTKEAARNRNRHKPALRTQTLNRATTCAGPSAASARSATGRTAGARTSKARAEAVSTPATRLAA